MLTLALLNASQISRLTNYLFRIPAYKREALRWHPDRDEGNTTKFQKISDAYYILSDPARRAEYDAARKAGSNIRDGRWKQQTVDAEEQFGNVLRSYYGNVR